MRRISHADHYEHGEVDCQECAVREAQREGVLREEWDDEGVELGDHEGAPEPGVHLLARERPRETVLVVAD